MNRLKVGYRMFICDGTGCIGIYSNKTYSLLPITDLNEGDSVEISGVIAHFNGLGQINFNSTGDTIRKLGLGKFQQPVTVTKLNESTESRLVRIRKLRIGSGKWVTTTDSYI
jgi:DNA/RNA endonuclease YhcR with UshA esterase domain